jgi:hypothetical protein
MVAMVGDMDIAHKISSYLYNFLFNIVTYQGGLRELRDVDSDWHLDPFAYMTAMTNYNHMGTA